MASSRPSDIPLSQTALILVDLQKGLRSAPSPTAPGGARSNPNVGANTTRLLAAFRHAFSTRLPRGQDGRTDPDSPTHIWHIRHHSLLADSALNLEHNPEGVQPEPYAELSALSGAREEVMVKHVNSAFIGTQLEARLRADNIRRLVVAGMTTDHCVSTTVRMAANLGAVVRRASTGDAVSEGEILLVGDATCAHPQREVRGATIDAETVQKVHLASLHGEFCRVVSAADVASELQARPGR